MFFTILAFASKSLLLLVLFVVGISFLGITTGIRKAYVNALIWLFEWVARMEESAAAAAEEEAVAAAEAAETAAKKFSSSSWFESTDPSECIIQHRWTQSIENKLVEQIDQQHNIGHPLAQRLMPSSSRRMSTASATDATSGGQGMEQQQQIQPNGNSNEQKVEAATVETTTTGEEEQQQDVEFATVKVIVNDMLEMLTAGIESIIEDNVTQRFEAAQLPTWNFLSRSQLTPGLRISWRSECIWALGALVRYGVLFPIRLALFCLSTGMISTLPVLIGSVPNRRIRFALYQRAMLMCMRMAARTFFAIITFHDEQNRPKYGICVANHTSPIDVMILSTDNCYAMVGQKQGGLLGSLQEALSRGAHHIWFERTESKDRHLVSKALQKHVEDPNRMPILIFPEGTCINNTSVMLFKKGAFETASTVYPIAMKYDNWLGDAFWNSHAQGYFAYMLSMMTAWALICEVWYLPPIEREPDENSIEFARRCQRAIAQCGGLVDLGWDGNLKRAKVPKRLRDEQRELFFQYLAQTTPICECGRPNREQMENIRREIHPEVYQQQQQQQQLDNNKKGDGGAENGNANCADNVDKTLFNDNGIAANPTTTMGPSASSPEARA